MAKEEIIKLREFASKFLGTDHDCPPKQIRESSVINGCLGFSHATFELIKLIRL
jgi:hypothetical protein